jgi:outer membrane protein
MSFFSKSVSIILALSVSLNCNLSHAITIGEAIKAVRENNFQIKANREQLKAIKTEKSKAITTFLPSVSAGGSMATRYYKDPIALSYNDKHTGQVSLNIDQPIFTGGSSAYSLDRASHMIDSAQAQLHGVKENIILSAIDAYEGLLTSRQIYDLNLKNEEVLTRHLKETEARFELKEATITDVSQAVSRLAGANADKIKASGDIASAEASYVSIVGENAPKDLQEIDYSKVYVPSSLEELMDITLRQNPEIKRSQSDSLRARDESRLAYSRLSPRLSAQAQFVRTDNTKGLYKNDYDTYLLNVEIPIYQRGEEYVNIKGARHQEKKAEYSHEYVRAAVTEKVIQAWSEYHTAKSLITATDKAIIAAQQALEGVTEEAKVGTRTTIEVLDAERELFLTKVENRKAKRRFIVSLYAMHALMGTLNKMDFA